MWQKRVGFVQAKLEVSRHVLRFLKVDCHTDLPKLPVWASRFIIACKDILHAPDVSLRVVGIPYSQRELAV